MNAVDVNAAMFVLQSDCVAGKDAGPRVQSGTANFNDAVVAGLDKYVGRIPGLLFAIAHIDACIIDAASVSLSTAFAIGGALTEALLAPQAGRCEKLLSGPLRADRGGGRIGANTERAAGAVDQRRSDSCRRTAAERDCLPGAPVQR
ncbi:hypothetical protein MPC1_12990002 [Methylocella tundrae]|nr:hypothetical protein MPC1_12990002 [Methylocella tundrae]